MSDKVSFSFSSLSNWEPIRTFAGGNMRSAPPRAENEKFNLRRIFFAIAVKKNISPTGGKLFGLFEKYINENNFAIGPDNLHSWVRKDNHTPRVGIAKENCLKLINHFLFDNKNDYINSFDYNWDELSIPRQVKNAVDKLLDEDEKFEPSFDRGFFNNVLIGPDYQIDPSDLMTQIINSRTGHVLNPHLLYHSPKSVDIWDTITRSPHYPLYRRCEDGLNALLQSEVWRERFYDVELMFNLGAGSASKDKLILRDANSYQDSKMYVWVDASLPMIRKTVQDANPSKYKNVNCLALPVDFEVPTKLRNQYNFSFPMFKNFENKKVFFILGFTLSNLYEENFFSEYSNICQKGDLFVFPMQFIPNDIDKNEDDLNIFKRELINSYNFEEGHMLAKSWSSLLDDDYEIEIPTPEPTIEHVQFCNNKKSICVIFNAIIKDKFGSIKSITTSRSIRHYKSDYESFLNSYGYKIVFETDPRDGVTTLLVEYTGY